MKRFLVCILALVLVTFMSLGSVLAKDICVGDSWGYQYIFKQVKALSKPGQASPLNGIVIYSDNHTAPFSGTAIVKADGTIGIGLFFYYAEYGMNWDAHLNGATFDTATGPFDNGPTGTSSGTMTFTGYINCKDIVLP
jgi:hypothetical protein